MDLFQLLIKAFFKLNKKFSKIKRRVKNLKSEFNLSLVIG